MKDNVMWSGRNIKPVFEKEFFWNNKYSIFSDIDKIIDMLGEIESDIQTLTDMVDVGFYKQKYQDNMEIIE